MAQAKP